ncbi:MAG: DUF5702 domain-containing protein, partial [Lachnospiraceae bacterium]|nr:DUF5702 domain-containing protein [Lachnospiraceae bacterium]
TRLIKTASSYFTSAGLAQTGTDMLLTFYMVEYDFNMFSSRVTNVDEDAEKAVSLTGYELKKSINYLYGAELEYIYGGYNSSDSNLSAARNKILAFRAVVNYAATYSVSEVNDCITVIADAASLVNPALGLLVSGALRLAVASCETVADWKLLIEGESVALIKTKLEDLTAFDKFADLIGSDDEPSGSSSAVKLDYEQYLQVLLLFLTDADTIAERTGNLITLNVNTVEQKIGSGGTLSELDFTMKNAVTAVDATCSVHLDFVVMPDSFAKQMLSSETYTELSEFQKNYYKFTVTRGY